MKKTLLLFTYIILSSVIFAQKSEIKGEISDANTNEKIPFASVSIQGTSQGTTSDLNGKFTIYDLSPGLYNIEISFIGYKKEKIYEVELDPRNPVFLSISLSPSTVSLDEVQIIETGNRLNEEAPVSLRKIGVNEVKRNPGGNRDISKAIRSLPGVASIPSFRNDIIIRGGAPSENRFYLDGIEVPNINHFATQGSSGGPVGLINIDLIQDVNFYSGAFPVDKGNALSSIMDFRLKEGSKEKNTIRGVIGSSDMALTFDGPTGEYSSIIVSARQSYLQFLFAALNLPILPTYNDFQVTWKGKINNKNKLTLIGLGAIDDFALNINANDDTTADNYESNEFAINTIPVNKQWNYTTGLRWDKIADKGRYSFFASRNMLNNIAYKHFNNDVALPKYLDYASQEMENKFRLERSLFHSSGKWIIGLLSEKSKYNNDTENIIYDFVTGSQKTVSYNSYLEMWKYGAYINYSNKFLEERLGVSLGGRIDGNDYNNDMNNPLNQLSPRLSLTYSLTTNLSINFNSGIYYQLPAYTILGYKEQQEFVNQKTTQYIGAAHFVGGLQYIIDDKNLIFSIEAFDKTYKNYPYSVDKQISLANLGADFGVIGTEQITSSSVGKAYGLEFLAQQKFYKGLYGIFAYTYVRSGFGNSYSNLTASAWDSQHIISLTGGKKFKNNLEVGFRFSYSGGLPYTPYDETKSILTDAWDINRSGVFNYDAMNSKRFDAFHQLDLRIDKKWYFNKWNLNLYFDLQNVYQSAFPAQPVLTVETDNNGTPVINPNDDTSYKAKYIDSASGSSIPSTGIIVAF